MDAQLASPVARISAIIADTLVICLTWVKTFNNVVTLYRFHKKVTLTMLIMRDGTIYFLYVTWISATTDRLT